MKKAFVYHKREWTLKMGKLMDGLDIKGEVYAPTMRRDQHGQLDNISTKQFDFEARYRASANTEK